MTGSTFSALTTTDSPVSDYQKALWHEGFQERLCCDPSPPFITLQLESKYSVSNISVTLGKTGGLSFWIEGEKAFYYKYSEVSPAEVARISEVIILTLEVAKRKA